MNENSEDSSKHNWNRREADRHRGFYIVLGIVLLLLAFVIGKMA